MWKKVGDASHGAGRPGIWALYLLKLGKEAEYGQQ
jgi:hypothetical protein